LTEGEKLYCRPAHERLAEAWKQGLRQFTRALRQLGSFRPVTGKLTTHLLQREYPLFRKQPQREALTPERVEVVV
jgi:hypothetical protein